MKFDILGGHFILLIYLRNMQFFFLGEIRLHQDVRNDRYKVPI